MIGTKIIGSCLHCGRTGTLNKHLYCQKCNPAPKEMDVRNFCNTTNTMAITIHEGDKRCKLNDE